MKTEDKSDEFLKANVLNNIYPEIGITEWFHKDDYKHVERTIKDMNILGLKELRVVMSKEDFYSDGGEQWYDWMFENFSESLKILPCLFIGSSSFKTNLTNGFSEKEIKTPEEFISALINRYGAQIDFIEVQYKLDRNVVQYLSPSIFLYLYNQIVKAAQTVHESGKKLILGGIKPDDAKWFQGRSIKQFLDYIDIIGITAFPEKFDTNWKGWSLEIEKIEDVLKEQNNSAEIWITDTGYSTWRNDEPNQMPKFLSVLKSPVNRVYWYSLYDNLKDKELHFDEKDYHFGMKKSNGEQKLLFRMLSQYKISQLEKEVILNSPPRLKNISNKKGVLITGGAGFIGINLANRLLNEGKRVIIYDNLSRQGVENNLKWLLSIHPELEFMVADVNDVGLLEKAVNEAYHVFHFAAQVAVTSSLQFPEHDYKINSSGTFNVLDTIRLSRNKPSLIFTSTNKVYGDLSGLQLTSDKKRYFPVDPEYYQNGINETYPLNFHSPYGCSKGCADQYVLDYARSYGLKNVVFRMSCIYGPHQFGTEDQGWIAHFLNQSIRNNILTIFGDGKQVRDILFIDDLINAFLLAMDNIDTLYGQAFNIGGGPENAISLLDLINIMHKLDHLKIRVIYDSWRTGDQKYYVSDTRKFRTKTGWKPKVSYREGVTNIFNWLYDHHHSQKMILK